MAQSVSKVVDVDITISPKAAPVQGFGTMCIFGDSDVISPTERYRTYTNLNEVVSDFGLESEEYKAAELYFSQDPAPDNLMIARWNRYGSPAVLVGGYLTEEQQDITKWQRITNGSLSFDLNGENIDVLNLDFSKQTNLNGVAEVINQKLDGANIKWDGQKFVLSTEEVGEDQTLSYMFFTDKQENIHRMLGLAEDQATIIQGTDYVPAIPEQPASAGFLTGTDARPSIDAIKKVKNGSFKITVNDIEVPVNNLDFTSAEGLGADKALVEIAKIIDRAMKPNAFVTSEDGHLVITSNSVGENSIVENATAGESYPVAPGYLEGTAISGSGTLAGLKGITTGSFNIPIDGKVINVTDLDFSNDDSFEDIAQTIAEKLKGHATVAYDGEKFVITSNTLGTSSKVLRATQGEIKGVKPGYLTGTAITTSGSGSGSLSAITEVDSGSIRIPIDNEVITLKNLDFSDADNLSAVANVLSIALAGRASVKASGNQLIVTSNTLGSKSKVLKALAGEKYEVGGTNGYLTGTTVVSGSISTLQAVESGSFKIQIDGREQSVKDVDLSEASSMSQVAQILQNKLSPYAKVTYSGDHFVITSNTTGSNSTVSKGMAGEVYDSEEATSGYLTGTSITSKLDDIKGITNGSFNITIDGSLVQVQDLDFSEAQDIQDVVDVLYDHLNEKATISFSGDKIVITSKTTGAASNVSTAEAGEQIEIGQTSGYLTGTQVDTSQLGNIKAITDGSMRIAIDGDTKSLTNLNFSNAADMGGVADILGNALSGAAVVTYSEDHFVVTSNTTGDSSTVAAATEGEQIAVGGTSGYLTSANLTNSDNLLSIKQIDNGTMKIQVDSTPLNLTGLDFSQINSFEDAAEVLRPKLASYATVECVSGSGDNFNLKITSLTSGGSSLVSYATEGDPVYDGGTSAKLTSAEITASGTAAYLEALQDVKNGCFRISIDGEERSVTELDFSSCMTLDDVATVIGNKMTDYATVDIETAGLVSYLTITSKTTGETSTISKPNVGNGTTITTPAIIESKANIPLEDLQAITNGGLYYRVNLNDNTSTHGLNVIDGINFSKCSSYQEVCEVLNDKFAGYGIVEYSEEKKCFLFRGDPISTKAATFEFLSLSTNINQTYAGLGYKCRSYYPSKKILDPEAFLESLKKITAGLLTRWDWKPKTDYTKTFFHEEDEAANFSGVTSYEDVINILNTGLTYNRAHFTWTGERFVFETNYYITSTQYSEDYPNHMGSHSYAPYTYTPSKIKDYLNNVTGYKLVMDYGDNVTKHPWLKESGDIYITINDHDRTRITLPGIPDEIAMYYRSFNQNQVWGMTLVAKINQGLINAGIYDDRVLIFGGDSRNDVYLVSNKTGTSAKLIIEVPEDNETFQELSTLLSETHFEATEDNSGFVLDLWTLLGFEPPIDYTYSETDLTTIFDVPLDERVSGESIAPNNYIYNLLYIGTTSSIVQGTNSNEPSDDNQLYLRLGLNSGSATQKQGEDILNHYNMHELLGLDDGTPTSGSILYNDNQAHTKLGLNDGTPTPGMDAVLCDNQLHTKLGLANGTPTNGQPIYSVTDLHTRLGLANGTETPGEDNDNQVHTKLHIDSGNEVLGKNNENGLHILLGLLYGISTPGHDIIPEIPAKPATAGKIISGPVDIEALSQVVDGNFKLTVDGESQNDIYRLNMSGVNSVSGVADILNSVLNGATAEAAGSEGQQIRVTSDGERLIITSNTTGSGSSVSYATGLDLLIFSITDMLAMTKELATSLSNGLDPESAKDTVAVMALETADWYAAVIASADMPSDDELLELAQYIETQNETAHILGLTITDKRILEREYKNDLASRCKELGLNRTVAMYSSSSPYAVCAFLGRAFVVNFNGVNTTITMMFKQAKLVVAEDITNTEADTLKDKRCNVFIKYQNGTAIIQYGVMTGDYYFDERHGADWLRNYIQTALYNLLYTSTTKIPQTDDGMNLIVTVINDCLAQAQANGLIGSGTWLGYEFGSLKRGDVMPTGYYVYAPAMSTQTQADRDQRISVPIQIAAKLQGAIHSIDVGITLNR